MRDPNRIDRVVELLREAWLLDPDFRLTQLVIVVSNKPDDLGALWHFGGRHDGAEAPSVHPREESVQKPTTAAAMNTPNKRPAMDAGWPALFAFQRPRPAAMTIVVRPKTHA